MLCIADENSQSGAKPRIIPNLTLDEICNAASQHRHLLPKFFHRSIPIDDIFFLIRKKDVQKIDKVARIGEVYIKTEVTVLIEEGAGRGLNDDVF